MKGIIFNILEDFIVEVMGPDAYDSIVSECPLITRDPFIGPGTYPDEDLVAIIVKVADRMQQPVPALLKMFGRYAFPKLAAKFPNFIEAYSHPKPFLKTIDWFHVTEVKKLYEDASPPRFYYTEPSEDRLVMIYWSPRKLCPMIEGILEAVSEHFKTPVLFTHTRCMHRGDAECEFQISFPPKA